jgi:hypothetical protein
MPEYDVFIDAITEGEWFRSLSPELRGADLITYQDASNSEVEKLTQYERPDIILFKNGEPVLVVEKTSHVPTGENTLQRVARMVNAAELGIPGLFYTPYAKMKGDKGSKGRGKCNLNYRFIEGLRRIGEHNNTPMLIPPWPYDEDYYLVRDGSEDDLVSDFVDQFLKNDCNPDVPAGNEIRQETEREVERILSEYPPYKSPPGKIDIVSTESYLNRISSKSGLSELNDVFEERDKTVVVTNDMSPGSCDRVDPYGGAQFAYDYMYCRAEASTYERDRNLVIQVPSVFKERWLEANPYKPENKSSLWYECADVIELQDSILADFESYRHNKLTDF